VPQTGLEPVTDGL